MWRKISYRLLNKRRNGRIRKVLVKKRREFFIQNSFVRRRLKVYISKISFLKEKKFWIEFPRYKWRGYNSDAVEEIDCLKFSISIPKIGKLISSLSFINTKNRKKVALMLMKLGEWARLHLRKTFRKLRNR